MNSQALCDINPRYGPYELRHQVFLVTSTAGLSVLDNRATMGARGALL
jgi:hypothetical protein